MGGGKLDSFFHVVSGPQRPESQKEHCCVHPGLHNAFGLPETPSNTPVLPYRGCWEPGARKTNLETPVFRTTLQNLMENCGK